jgi:hypothetical protein
MSPSTTQQWTRRIRYSDQHMRVSDAERSAVAEELGKHYADGRLDQAEFDERISRTMSAKTRGDLAGLFDDLPDTDSTAGAGPAATGASSAPYRMRRRGGGILRPLIVLAIALVCANIAWHAFTSIFFFQPVIWLALFVGIVLVLTRGSHHHRHDR